MFKRSSSSKGSKEVSTEQQFRVILKNASWMGPALFNRFKVTEHWATAMKEAPQVEQKAELQ